MIDKTVQCWGISNQRELGRVARVTAFAEPRAGITDAVDISAASRSATHLCFMRDGSDGAGPVGCIGNRTVGRSGAPTPMPRVAGPMPYHDLPGIEERL